MNHLALQHTIRVFLCFDAISQQKVALRSQVIGLLAALDAKAVIFNLITFAGLREWFQMLREGSLPPDLIEGAWQAIWLPKPRECLGLRVASMMLGLLLHHPILRRQSILVHCRGIHSAVAAHQLRRVYPKIAILLDLRDDIAAEYLFDMERRGRSTSDPAIHRKYSDLKALERQAVAAADHILCVSGPLKEALIKQYSIADENVTVIPCLADSSLFYFDPRIRHQVRQALDLKGKFVLVYSGSLYPWQFPDQMRTLYITLQRFRTELHLLVLSPHLDRAKQVFRPLLEKKQATILTAEHKEAPRYLMAADIGLLIRGDHPLNTIASPIKAAEYLMCGLPMIITPRIGDISTFVTDHQLGILLPDPENPAAIAEAFLRMYPSPPTAEERVRISQHGTERFARERHLGTFIELYARLAAQISQL